jgi:NADPH-dependent ferric siderophore reductase
MPPVLACSEFADNGCSGHYVKGDVHVFVHGEAGFVMRLRRHLFTDRGLDGKRVSLSGYWRLGKNGWQAEKAETAREEREAAAS